MWVTNSSFCIYCSCQLLLPIKMAIVFLQHHFELRQLYAHHSNPLNRKSSYTPKSIFPVIALLLQIAFYVLFFFSFSTLSENIDPLRIETFFAAYSWVNFIMDSIFAPFAQHNLEYKWNSKFIRLKLNYNMLHFVKSTVVFFYSNKR